MGWNKRGGGLDFTEKSIAQKMLLGTIAPGSTIENVFHKTFHPLGPNRTYTSHSPWGIYVPLGLTRHSFCRKIIIEEKEYSNRFYDFVYYNKSPKIVFGTLSEYWTFYCMEQLCPIGTLEQ